MRRNISGTYKQFDFLLFFMYLALTLFGLINIYSATYTPSHPSLFDFSMRYGKQFVWILAALFLMLVTLLIDSKFFSFIAYPSYIFALLLLVIVFFTAHEVNGARSWIQVGSFRFQPAEFTKVAAALTLAKVMSRQTFDLKRLKDILFVGVIILTPMVLILLQNDTGSALVYTSFVILFYRKGLNTLVVVLLFAFVALFFLILVLPKLPVFISLVIIFFLIDYFISKNKREVLLWTLIYLILLTISLLANYYLNLHKETYLIFSVVTAGIMLVYLLYTAINLMSSKSWLTIIFIGMLAYSFSVNYTYNKILEPHQRKRIDVLLGIDSDPLGAGYNVLQSKISIGSGGFWGKGFLQGTQTKYDFVPEQSTDFIFCTIGEEYGFVGSTFFLIFYLLFIVRITYIAERQRSEFSKMYGYAVVSVLFFHFMLNVGMTLGLMPVIGIPLPFISYGGSSLWTFTIMIAILLRLDINRNEIIT